MHYYLKKLGKIEKIFKKRRAENVLFSVIIFCYESTGGWKIYLDTSQFLTLSEYESKDTRSNTMWLSPIEYMTWGQSETTLSEIGTVGNRKWVKSRNSEISLNSWKSEDCLWTQTWIEKRPKNLNKHVRSFVGKCTLSPFLLSLLAWWWAASCAASTIPGIEAVAFQKKFFQLDEAKKTCSIPSLRPYSIIRGNDLCTTFQPLIFSTEIKKGKSSCKQCWWTRIFGIFGSKYPGIFQDPPTLCGNIKDYLYSEMTVTGKFQDISNLKVKSSVLPRSIKSGNLLCIYNKC